MGHLQRVLQRTSISASAIRPRIELWSPLSAASEVLDAPADTAQPAEQPASHSPSAGLLSDRVESSSTSRLPYEAHAAPPAEAAEAPPSAPIAASRTGPAQAVELPTRGLASANAHDPEQARERIPSGPALHDVARAAEDGHPEQRRVGPDKGPHVDLHSVGPRLAVADDRNPIRKPLAIPFVPDRREPRYEREPDVIISIGRIEVRAPATEERPNRATRTGKSPDVERLEQYVQKRLQGRTA